MKERDLFHSRKCLRSVLITSWNDDNRLIGGEITAVGDVVVFVVLLVVVAVVVVVVVVVTVADAGVGGRWNKIETIFANSFSSRKICPPPGKVQGQKGELGT